MLHTWRLLKVIFTLVRKMSFDKVDQYYWYGQCFIIPCMSNVYSKLNVSHNVYIIFISEMNTMEIVALILQLTSIMTGLNVVLFFVIIKHSNGRQSVLSDWPRGQLFVAVLICPVQKCLFLLRLLIATLMTTKAISHYRFEWFSHVRCR